MNISQTFNYLTLSFFAAILFFQTQAIDAQTKKLLALKPGNVVDKLYLKKKQNPRISQAALAAYGNSLIKAHGLDFYTDNCYIAEVNNKPGQDFSEQPTIFNFAVEDSVGRQTPLRISTKDWSSACGCHFTFPLLSINEKEWTVLAGKTPIRLKRTENIDFEEVRLLDKTRKKVLRRWYKPLDNEPEAISADGAKIYVSPAYDRNPGLLLEISETGTFRLVPQNLPGIIKTHKDILNSDDGSGFDELRQFRTKNRSYLLRYHAPCT